MPIVILEAPGESEAFDFGLYGIGEHSHGLPIVGVRTAIYTISNKQADLEHLGNGVGNTLDLPGVPTQDLISRQRLIIASIYTLGSLSRISVVWNLYI